MTKILLLLLFLSFTFSINAQWQTTYVSSFDPVNFSNNFIYNIQFRANHGIASGWHDSSGTSTGLILYSSDHGETWNRAGYIKTPRFWDIDYTDDNSAFALTLHDQTNSTTRLQKSTDGGATWSVSNPAPFQSPAEIHFFNDSEGIGIENGLPGKATSDGGITWNSTDTTIHYCCSMGDNLFFFNRYEGIYVGNNCYSSLIYTTADGGNSWTLKKLSPVPADVKVTGNLVYILGQSSFTDETLLYLSSDRGKTWQKKTVPGMIPQTFIRILNMAFDGPNGIIIFSFDGENIWYSKTFDGGGTWTEPSTIDEFRRFDFFDAAFNSLGEVVIAGHQQNSETRIIMSTNFGGRAVNPVELSSFTSGIDNGAVLLRWSTATETNNKGFEIQKIIVQNNNESEKSNWGYAAFVAGKGTTTEQQHYSYKDKSPAAGTIKYRLKQVDYDGSFEYSEELTVNVNIVPSEFALEQNYPNPFNPATNIKYSIAHDSHVKIELHTVMGEKVKVLADEYKTAGSYELSFDGWGLSSGTYIYRLTTGSTVINRKMILMK